MTEAIFGLVGVVIGGLLNGGVSWLSDRGKLRRNARVAARLVLSEIRENDFSLGWGLERKEVEPLERVESAAWEQWRETFADGLNDSEWRAINDYYVVLIDVRKAVREMNSPELLDKDRELVNDVKQDGNQAREAMETYSKRHKRAPRRLSRSD